MDKSIVLHGSKLIAHNNQRDTCVQGLDTPNSRRLFALIEEDLFFSRFILISELIEASPTKSAHKIKYTQNFLDL